jgi:hypothetical protein
VLINKKELRSRAIKAVSGELRERRLNPAEFDGDYALRQLHRICKSQPTLTVAIWYKRLNQNGEVSISQRRLFIREWNKYHQRGRAGRFVY